MAPRSQGEPRPVSEPSSDIASAMPIEMPAPTEAASPTRKVSWLLWVAKAAANSGASVDTDPSIRPARPGCTICSTNMRWAACSSSFFTPSVRCFSPNACASETCLSSAAIRSPSSLRVLASVVRSSALI